MTPRLLAAASAVALLASFGCSAETPESRGETSDSLVASDPCTPPIVGSAQASACFDWIKNHAPFCEYKRDVYDCKDFSNDFCATAGNEGLACAELGIKCAADGGVDGHVVAVVYVPGIGCVATDPQNDDSWGPWPPVAGSCNTYAPNLPSVICTSVYGPGATPTCTTGLVRSGFPTDGDPNCVPVVATATASANAQ